MRVPVANDRESPAAKKSPAKKGHPAAEKEAAAQMGVDPYELTNQ